MNIFGIETSCQCVACHMPKIAEVKGHARTFRFAVSAETDAEQIPNACT